MSAQVLVPVDLLSRLAGYAEFIAVEYKPDHPSDGQFARLLAALPPERERCPSCEHGMDEFHREEGCWFTVERGRPGANLTCPCDNGPKSARDV